jgi:feruloyl esterase
LEYQMAHSGSEDWIKIHIMRLLLMLFAARLAAAASTGSLACPDMAGQSLPHVTIKTAERITAGSLPVPGQQTTIPDLPAFCRIAGTIQPTSDSDIQFEVWLPDETAWNSRYLGAGNGGFAGSINYGGIASALRRGYATASTDTGHGTVVGGGFTIDASWANGHPEKLIDYGYRAIHETTITAKTLIKAFYQKKLEHSYFSSCSNGGRQALMEAQRYPEDYDGIVAGSATNNFTAMMFGRIWVGQATLSDPASYIPAKKYPMIHKAALAACDAMDGVEDGVIGEPMQCKVDPGVLECKAGADGAECLTKAQVEAAWKIYTPATNPRTGEVIFPAMERGSELVWGRLAGGPKPIELADDFFKYVVFEDPGWDFRTLNFDGDVAKAKKKDGGVLSATDADLRPFFARGGKLVQYHGWTDQQVMPENSINYYKSVVAKVGQVQVDGSYRLFMAPGMNHCGGGDGPNEFDMLGALEQWREGGKAPEQVIAAHSVGGVVDRRKPICAYPEVAKYKGVGRVDEAESFVCKASGE